MVWPVWNVLCRENQPKCLTPYRSTAAVKHRPFLLLSSQKARMPDRERNRRLLAMVPARALSSSSCLMAGSIPADTRLNYRVDRPQMRCSVVTLRSLIRAPLLFFPFSLTHNFSGSFPPTSLFLFLLKYIFTTPLKQNKGRQKNKC